VNIHEFQAKEILRKYGVPVLEGGVARTPEKSRYRAPARRHGRREGADPRRRAREGRRVKVVRSPEEAAEFARKLLGKPLITHQTGPEGRIVRQVLSSRAVRSRASSTSVSWSIAGAAAPP